MAQNLLLGLFHEATPTADAIEGLHKLGIPDRDITIMSDIPYKPEWLGRPPIKGHVGLIAIMGAILGLLTALFLTAGIFLLYPLYQGGQPLVPVPPSLIVFFEVTMLGTMWATFFGLIFLNRFPAWVERLYDPRITEGHIGVLVSLSPQLIDQAEEVMKANGAHHLKRLEGQPGLFARRPGGWPGLRSRLIATLGGPDPFFRIFWIALVLIVLGGLVTFGVVPYGLIEINYPTQMENQVSIAYDQGPRLAAPAAAVPVEGPVLIADQPATNPVPSTPDSLQRGKVLYGLTCIICHGAAGDGKGPVGAFFTPKPADLTSSPIQALSDAQLFLVITQGFGVMPSIRENLDVQDRWDVINYVRTLKK